MNVVDIVQMALAAFTALVGWPVLLGLVITILEYFGVLSPDSAGQFNFWANVAIFGGILVLALLGKVDLVSTLDALFGNFAQLISIVLVILGIPAGHVLTNAWRKPLRKSAFFANRIQ